MFSKHILRWHRYKCASLKVQFSTTHCCLHNTCTIVEEVEDGLKLRVKWLAGRRRPSPCEIQNALQVGGIWFKAGYKSRDALNICFSPLQMYPMYADQIVSLSMFLWAIGLGGCEVETHNLVIKSQSPCNTNKTIKDGWVAPRLLNILGSIKSNQIELFKLNYIKLAQTISSSQTRA